MKCLDVTQVFTQWDGETPIAKSKDDNSPLRLVNVILALANECHQMGLSNLDKAAIFKIARLAGKIGAKEISIEQADYDALKKAVDANVVKQPQQPDQDFFAPAVYGQLKPMIDSAANKD